MSLIVSPATSRALQPYERYFSRGRSERSFVNLQQDCLHDARTREHSYAVLHFAAKLVDGMSGRVEDAN